LAPGLFECQRTRQAADKLALGGPLAGQAFFITNQDPVPFWSFTGDILEGLGYRRPYIHLPRLLVLAIAILFEYVIRPLLRPFKELTTDFTVFRVNIVTRQRMFSSKKAQGMLGYKPAVSLKEGIQRTVKAFSSLRADAASKAKAA
jgi:sterol-4alpha-carboxylate 3-dehydrogenase (decarboxylating)